MTLLRRKFSSLDVSRRFIYRPARIWIIVLLSYATRWWSRSFSCVGADAQGQDEASAQPQQQDSHDEQEDFFPWLARVTNTVGFGGELPSGPPEWFPLYDCAHARDKEMNSALTNSVRINWLVNFARSLPDTAQCEDFFLVDDAPPEETNSAAASIQANENTAYQQCGSIFLAPAVIRVAPPAQSLRLVFQKFGNALANLHWNLRHYCYILNFLFRHFGNVQDFAKLDDTKIQREQLARVGGGQGEDAGKQTTTPEECNYWGRSEKNENQLDLSSAEPDYTEETRTTSHDNFYRCHTTAPIAYQEKHGVVRTAATRTAPSPGVKSSENVGGAQKQPIRRSPASPEIRFVVSQYRDGLSVAAIERYLSEHLLLESNPRPSILLPPELDGTTKARRPVREPAHLRVLAESLRLILVHENLRLPAEIYHARQTQTASTIWDPTDEAPKPTERSFARQAQHLHDADLAYLGYRSRDTLPAKAFRLDSHALANLMARWQDLAYPFLSKHHGLMERRMRAQRERDQKENQKLIDEIRSSGSEGTPTNSSNSLSWSSSASGLHATGGTDQEEEIAYVFRILVYHCDLLSRKFAESKYIGSLFGSYNTNRYFARTPRATHRFVENASKDALARYEVRGSFNFTNLAYKLSADVSWAKRAFKQQVEEVANILDGFDEDSDQPVLGPQHDRASQSELQKKFPHMMREYAYYARTLGDSGSADEAGTPASWLMSHLMYPHHPQSFRTALKTRVLRDKPLASALATRERFFVGSIVRPALQTLQKLFVNVFQTKDFLRMENADAVDLVEEDDELPVPHDQMWSYSPETLLPVYTDGFAPIAALAHRRMRALSPGVFVAYDEMVQYFDSYYRVYATNMAAENAFQILENGYDIDLEVRHARKGYTIACQREVYKAFVRASQNMQDLNEPTAMARRVVAKDERFVAEKLVKRWSDPGEHQNQCYRDPLFAADIQRHPLLGGRNHSVSAMSRRMLRVPKVDYEFVWDYPGLVAQQSGGGATASGGTRTDRESSPTSTSLTTLPAWLVPEKHFAANSRFHVLHYLVLQILGNRTTSAAAAKKKFFFAEIGTRNGDTPRYLMEKFDFVCSLIVDIFWIDSTGADIFQRFPGRASFIKSDSARVPEERISKQFFNKHVVPPTDLRAPDHNDVEHAHDAAAATDVEEDAALLDHADDISNVGHRSYGGSARHRSSNNPRGRGQAGSGNQEAIATKPDSEQEGRSPAAAGEQEVTSTSSSASSSSGINKFDLIFIDGDHSYNGVRRDLDAWWPRLSTKGVLSGHDFDIQWYGVVLAVLDFVQEKNLKLWLGPDAVWWVYK